MSNYTVINGRSFHITRGAGWREWEATYGELVIRCEAHTFNAGQCISHRGTRCIDHGIHYPIQWMVWDGQVWHDRPRWYVEQLLETMADDVATLAQVGLDGAADDAEVQALGTMDEADRHNLSERSLHLHHIARHLEFRRNAEALVAWDVYCERWSTPKGHPLGISVATFNAIQTIIEEE